LYYTSFFSWFGFLDGNLTWLVNSVGVLFGFGYNWDLRVFCVYLYLRYLLSFTFTILFYLFFSILFFFFFTFGEIPFLMWTSDLYFYFFIQFYYTRQSHILLLQDFMFSPLNIHFLFPFFALLVGDDGNYGKEADFKRIKRRVM